MCSAPPTAVQYSTKSIIVSSVILTKYVLSATPAASPKTCRLSEAGFLNLANVFRTVAYIHLSIHEYMPRNSYFFFSTSPKVSGLRASFKEATHHAESRSHSPIIKDSVVPGVPGVAPGWKLDQNPKAIPRLAGILWLQCAWLSWLPFPHLPPRLRYLALRALLQSC